VKPSCSRSLQDGLRQGEEVVEDVRVEFATPCAVRSSLRQPDEVADLDGQAALLDIRGPSAAVRLMSGWPVEGGERPVLARRRELRREKKKAGGCPPAPVSGF